MESLKHRIYLILYSLSILILLIAVAYFNPLGNPNPSLSTSSPEIHVTVIVSKDFGSTAILNESLVVERGTTALDALRIVSKVETSYGGLFVTSINDFKRREVNGVQVDWFYYINGLLAPVGAADYTLHDGDIERWDLHPWASLPAASAIIGDFPEPFLHGYDGDKDPTIIIFSSDFRSEAEGLAEELSKFGVEAGLKAMETISPDDETLGENNLIVIGYFTDDLPSELNRIYDRLGYYAHYDDGSVHALDWKGDVSRSFTGDVSMIQASKNPWSREGTSATHKVVWLIAGKSTESIRFAVNALVKGEALNLHGLLIVDGECKPLPLQEGMSEDER